MLLPIPDALPEPLRQSLLGFAREYLDEATPFGGRDEALGALDAWLEEPRAPHALIVAEAGRGKSALLARWAARVAQTGRTRVVFVPVSARFRTALGSASLGLLDAGLRTIAGMRGGAPVEREALQAEIEALLAEPGGDGAPRLVIVDGIDEAVGWAPGRHVRFVEAPGLKVLLSARTLADCDAAGWCERLGWDAASTRQIPLPPLDRGGLVEVLRSMGDPLAALGDREDLLRALERVTLGDPLLLRLYIDALRAGGGRLAFLMPGDLGRIPPGIEGYFERWWEEQQRCRRGAPPGQEENVQALLGAFSCALGPLGREDLDALLPSVDPESRAAALREIERFVIGDGRENGYVFSHPRLGYYHAERLSPAERHRWERRFLDHCSATLDRLEADPRTQVSEYVVRHHGAHLERAGAEHEALCRLVSPAWQQAWEDLDGTFEGFLGDIDRARRQVERSLALAPRPAERAAAVAELFRIALVRSSIQSLSTNVPAALCAALLEAEIWSPAVALAYAGGRLDVLAALAPLLPEAHARRALAELEPSEGDGEVLANWNEAVLVGLLGRLIAGGHAEEVLPLLRRHPPLVRALSLLRLVPQLPAALRPEALDEIYAGSAACDQRSTLRVTILLRLAALSPDATRRRLLDEAKAVKGRWSLDARTMGPLIRAGAFEEALAAADGESGFSAANALAHAVAATKGQEQAVFFKEWARVESGLHRREENSLYNTLPLPIEPALLDDLLAVVRDVPSRAVQAYSLVWIAHQHPRVLPEALAAVRGREGADRLLGLLTLAPVLEGEARASALAEVLAGLRERLSAGAEPAWEHADCRWKLGSEPWSQLPRGLLSRFAEAARLLPPEERSAALREGLRHSRRISDGSSQAQALAAFAGRLEEHERSSLLDQALAAARGARELRVEALCSVASMLSGDARHSVARDALAAISFGEREVSKSLVNATAVATLLPEPERREIVRRALEFWAGSSDFIDFSGCGLQRLAPLLPEETVTELWGAARPDEYPLGALAVLAVHLPEPRRLAAFEIVLDMVASFLDEPGPIEDVLSILIPHLPAALVRWTLDKLARVRSDNLFSYRWRIFMPELLIRLGALGYVDEAIDASRDICSPVRRAKVLLFSLPHQPLGRRGAFAAEAMESLGAALAAPEEHTYRPSNFEALVEAAKALIPFGYGPELVQRARLIPDACEAVSVLTGLAPELGPAQRREALALSLDRARRTAGMSSWALQRLSPYLAELDPGGLMDLLCRALQDLGGERRSQLLAPQPCDSRTSWLDRAPDPALIPSAIAQIGGAEAVLQAARACTSVTEWFP